MDSKLLEKLEMAVCWLELQRGQKSTFLTLLDNWAFCGEILEQVIGEEYERRGEL